MFNQARLKLTLWYLLMIFLVSATMSTLFYFRSSWVFEREWERIEFRWRNELSCEGPACASLGAGLKLKTTDLQLARENLAQQLIFINALIVLLAGIAGYFLAGKTLAPIQKTLEEQKRFVADAAHELRTPITALKTSLEVNLMDKKISRQANKILQENLEDVAGLEMLIGSLLKLAKVEGQVLQTVPVELIKITKKAVKQVQSLADKKKIKIICDLCQKDQQKFIVLGDKGALIDLISIFLDNAIKYSHQKTEINFTLSKHKSNAVMKIKDQGVGIATHHLKHIFDRFYRVDSARSKTNHDGYGLGLSVAQKIVDQHHGSIDVKSELGAGTTFTITLPLA
jgi:two-component system, OmpR family, sensor histidine kinase CiaH